MSLGTNCSFYSILVWSAASVYSRIFITSYRKYCLMCCPANEAIKSGTKCFLALTIPYYRRVTRRQVMRHFTSNGTDQCRNGSSKLLIPYRSNLDRFGLLSPTHGQRYQQQSGQITLQSVLIKAKFLKATHHTEIREIEIPRSMVVEALSW